MADNTSKQTREWMKTNQGLHPEMRKYFTALDSALVTAGVWPTTTTTTTTTSTSTTTTTA